MVAGCKTNPALCLNQAGIYAADIFASEAAIGVGPLAAGTTLIVGKSRDAVTKLGQQVMTTADEALKNKAFKVQPVAEVIKKDSSQFNLSSKTVSYLNSVTKKNNEINTTRVGRWMSADELMQTQLSGKVVQGGGGQTFVSINGAADFKGAASNGAIYVEFDVSTNSLLQGGKDGWFKLLGPDAGKSQQLILSKQDGAQLPEV
ncbi:TPA: hypothetical protein ACF7ZB_004546 [Kluyvera georgiana]